MSQSARQTRNLRVVRIDDRADGPISRDKYFPAVGDGVVRPPLDLVTFQAKEKIGIAINGLSAARLFWAQFSSEMIPDIVLGDVDFEEDASSPLQHWGREGKNHIPTGLMHCKPFAAMARAGGRPLSVMLHTTNPDQWSRMFDDVSPQGERKRVFALLAAQETMELAAILGDEIKNASRNNLQPVWDWLGSHSKSVPLAALQDAVKDYRYQLVAALQGETGSGLKLRVASRDWVMLRDWCQGLRVAPRKLRNGVDIGLPLLYPDGRIDRISLASLFADVSDVSDKLLPASCFELTRLAEPWELKNGMPQIGALVAECGEIGEAAIAAQKALKLLPLEATRLTVNLRGTEKDTLALGFAVLFRALEIYRNDDSRWERIWNEGHWHPGRLKETEDTADYDWALPACEWVAIVEKSLLKNDSQSNSDGAARTDMDEDAFMSVEDMIELFKAKVPAKVRNELTAAGVRWHVDVLCESGRVETHTGADGQIFFRIAKSNGAPKDGRRPGPPIGTGLSWESDAMAVSLRDSLGFGTRGPGVNDNAIGQILHDAFICSVEDGSVGANDRAKKGRDFLESFKSGASPAWIQETCRSYCRDVLRWVDEQRWPKCVATVPPMTTKSAAAGH